MSTFQFIDLFSGIGGFHLALEKQGGECVFASDIDKFAQKTYFDNFGQMPAGDITKIESKDIPDHDIVAAGFPCQAFSIAGRRRGFEDTRGMLFFDVARIIREKKPKAFILENVAGLISHDAGKTLAVIEATLEEIGYVFAWKLINAKDQGVPQNRNRWYCVGVRGDVAERLGITKDKIYTDVFPNPRPLEMHIDSLLEDTDDDSLAISEIARVNIQKNLLLRPIIEGDTFPLIANNIRPSKVSFSNSGVSPCLTAKMGTGGNNVPVIVHLNRRISVREGLRIMGFPDTYQINLSKSHAYKQIGNSVVLPVVTRVSANLVTLLNV